MSCFCDYDLPAFYNRTTPRARKAHQCYECGGNIHTGEQYECATGKWDGEVGTYRTCERCHDLRQWVENNVPCACWAHGNLFEDCENAIDDARWRAPEETRGLRFGYLRRRVLIDRFNGRQKTTRALSASQTPEKSDG